MKGHIGVVQELLNKGVDTTAQDSHGKTALKWAQTQGQSKVAEALQNHSKNIKPKEGHASMWQPTLQGGQPSNLVERERPGKDKGESSVPPSKRGRSGKRV